MAYSFEIISLIVSTVEATFPMSLEKSSRLTTNIWFIQRTASGNPYQPCYSGQVAVVWGLTASWARCKVLLVRKQVLWMTVAALQLEG